MAAGTNTEEPAVTLKGASKSYGEVQALSNVDLTVRPGEVVALLGPNGAGKTTAISLMLGLRKLTSGSAEIFGQDSRNPASRRRVGAMLQESGVPETLKVREVAEMFSRLYERPIGASSALQAAGLWKKAGAKIGNLSGGERQRLYFALSIVGGLELLFLDEPTVGLDVESRRAFWGEIRGMIRRGKTIVLTTHYLEEADALAERIVVINRGEIVAEGDPEEIKARVGGKIIRFSSPNLGDGLPPDIPGVERVNRREDNFKIYSTEPEAVLESLFERNVKVRKLEVVGAGLEEAFVALTGGADDMEREDSQ